VDFTPDPEQQAVADVVTSVLERDNSWEALVAGGVTALAAPERLGGDEATFVERMNAKGKELGLSSTHFANPHGLPDPAQKSTARDMAQLTARLLHDYPMSRPLLGGQTFIYRGRVYTRHIPLFNDPGGGFPTQFQGNFKTDFCPPLEGTLPGRRPAVSAGEGVAWGLPAACGAEAVAADALAAPATGVWLAGAA